MDLVIDKRSEIKLSVYGQPYTLTKPTVKQAKEFQDKMKNNPGMEAEMAAEFLAKLGLPKEVTESLEVEHFGLIVDKLIGSKKN